MDRQTEEGIAAAGGPAQQDRGLKRKVTRRRAMQYGIGGVAALAGTAGLAHLVVRSAQSQVIAEVFENDAPKGEIWELWRKRGWAKVASHYTDLGRNVKCQLCPNACLLQPEDRSCCRNRVNKDGTLYTLVYANPCSFNLLGGDPIEKKPLFHFLPGTMSYSIATSGCGFRCLNCQNWEISQKKPEEAKDPHGPEVRITPQGLRARGITLSEYRRGTIRREDVAALYRRGTMLPEDVVALAQDWNCRSIAYTYSEPAMFFEYMYDTAKLARDKNVKNVWVTCGYIQAEPLRELCRYMDAANVDLKSFDDAIYKKLNSGKLQPILDTLQALKQHNVWFEVTNLIVPTYTDKMDMMKRMCDYLAEKVGVDYPLHFSRFHPKHKLTRLPPTPVDVLLEAKSIALAAGLRYVYIGNVRGVADAANTFCPGCKKLVLERYGYRTRPPNLTNGKCKFCRTKIAGVWSA